LYAFGGNHPTVDSNPSSFSGTVLTDVGSVKAPVVEAIAPLGLSVGILWLGRLTVALKLLCRIYCAEALCAYTSSNDTGSGSEDCGKIAQSLGATVYHCRPDDHDRAVSWVSHLPVIVSAGLIAACMSETDPGVLALAQHLASSGFRDTSRVGGGNPELG